MENGKLWFAISGIVFIIAFIILYFVTAQKVTTPTVQLPVQPTPASSSTTGKNTSTGSVSTSTTTVVVTTNPAQNETLLNKVAAPDEFTKNFYTWYLQGVTRNIKFVSTTQFSSTIGDWLTQDFALNFRDIASRTNGDPVLLAQDYQNSWATNIQTTVTDRSATSSTVILSMGNSSELHKVAVHLISAENTWRVSSVTPSSN